MWDQIAPYMPFVLLMIAIGIALVVGFAVYYRSTRENSENGMISIPSGRTDGEIRDITKEEEESEPAVEIFIWRWRDVACTKIEKIKITSGTITDWSYKLGHLKLAWLDDGKVIIDTDHTTGDEDLSTDEDEKKRGYSRVFFWYKKVQSESKSSSSARAPYGWHPLDVFKLTLDNGDVITVEMDAYDDMQSDIPDLVIETCSNGIVRVTTKAGAQVFDTTDVEYTFGFSLIDQFTQD